MKIVMYTTEHCPSCVEAKNFLKSKSLDFDVINAEKDFDKICELAKANNWKSMPMIFIDDKFIGGANELRKALI
jgi:glutaredoxin 3